MNRSPAIMTPASFQRSAQWPMTGRKMILVTANELRTNPTINGEPPSWIT
jgi:hypothetical protein